jgi:mycothiol synthase
MDGPRPDLVRRPLVPADVTAFLSLVNAYDLACFGEPMVDLEDLQADWQTPGHDLATGSLGVWAAGRLVAAATLGPRGRVEAYVAADHRGGGLEEELLEAVEAEAGRRGLPAVDAFVPERDADGTARLRDRGYVLHHTSWILQLAPGAPVAERVLPPGYAVRPFRPEDAEEAFAVVAEAFGEWTTSAEWDATVLRRPGVDTGTFRVATWHGRLVGVCVVFDGAEEAWVSELAVHRDHRGRGVAQQLLAEAYRAARARGLSSGGLSTDTRTGALDLYLRLGMRVLHTVHNWSRDLRG